MSLLALGSQAFADQLDSIYNRLLARPDDYALNMQFAAAAEADPKSLRHAYAAYARAVAANPNDQAARTAYERVRLSLLPPVTTVTAALGVSYASNPRELPSSSRGGNPDLISDVTTDASAKVTDERNFAGVRWRTVVDAYGQFQGRANDVNIGYLQASSGPVFRLDEKVWLHLAPSIANVWVGGQQLYTDLGGRATLSTVAGGLTQSLSAGLVYRRVNVDQSGLTQPSGFSDGTVFDVEARLAMIPGLFKSDVLYISPQVKVSHPDGGAPAQLFNDPLFTGQYVEAGGRVSYFVPVAGPRAFLGVGLTYQHRWYDQNVAGLTDKRRDDYLEPTAHLILPSAIAPKVDLRFDYRYERNDTNESTEKFDNHVAGARVVGRF